MSKMADLYLDIRTRLENGEAPETVATEVGVSVDWVLLVLKTMREAL